MLISWNLLNDILTIPASLQEVAERLTLTGCEVESVDYPCALLKDVRSARIEKMERHPLKENLFVASVHDCAGSALVVTAAPNLSAGDIVPWGRPGAALADAADLGDRAFDPLESCGMLLSAAVLGIPEPAADFGILRPPSAPAPAQHRPAPRPCRALDRPASSLYILMRRRGLRASTAPLASSRDRGSMFATAPDLSSGLAIADPIEPLGHKPFLPRSGHLHPPGEISKRDI